MASDGINMAASSAQKSPTLSKDMAAFVDRLSQPKRRNVRYTQSRSSSQKQIGKSREGLEMDFPGSSMQLTPRSSTESLSRSKASKSQIELNIQGSVHLDVPISPHRSTPSSSQTNLSRELAASVERLSRPRSRKQAMHQNRLSLNLDEQWKSLEEAFQSNLQQTPSSEKSEYDVRSVTSSRESICSQSTNASFGSRSSLFGSRGFNQSGKLRGNDRPDKIRGGSKETEPNLGRRKARSERLLASMDSLNFSMNGRNFGGSKSLSPSRPHVNTISKSRTVSVDRLSNVGSRLMTPTLSSTLKHRVASETKLNRTSSNVSLASKGKDGKRQPRSLKQRLNTRNKHGDDTVGTKIKSLAGEFLFSSFQ